ncbi:phosphate-starvation-inducible protein PsiE [Exiguobacterium sp. s196]|uniref:phosphate-starvation-inducible protein PsiE n=1 Tax=Exiguobacterium sp. s196 TaxID=2751283 RepID=UPI001BECD686
MKNKKLDFSVPVIFQFALNTALILLAFTFFVLLGKEIIYFIQFSIFNEGVENQYKLLERILIFFLYFEFIAMIIKYFQGHYRFPLRYFLYIGITAMIRLIIVYHENPIDTLLYASAILVLIVGYYIMSSTSAMEQKC